MVRDVPRANPAALIIGAENDVRATVLPTASPIASADPEDTIEPFEVGTGLVDRRLRLVGRVLQLLDQWCRLGPEVVELTPDVTQSIEHTHEDHDEGRESDRTQDSSDDEEEFAGSHVSSSPCVP